MSGSGSNARAVCEYCRSHAAAFAPVLILTDVRESAAAEIARTYQLELAVMDMKEFYLEHGEKSTRLDSPRRMEIRDLWSDQAFELLQERNIELVLLAGFFSMTNLTGKIPCLNVHPGDLTVCSDDGKRIFAGLHYAPVENAVCGGYPCLKSSVILAQPYSGNVKDDTDTGPVLGISVPVEIRRGSRSAREFEEIRLRRKKGEPVSDILRELAAEHIERLKIYGDHCVFPAAADDFAAGRFAVDGTGKLHYSVNGSFIAVETVQYSGTGAEPVLQKDGFLS